MSSRRAYPSDVSDEEWALVAPYLCLLPEDCGQRRHPLRELFNGLRYVVRHGIPWRAMPNDLPPWAAVHQQAMRWLRAGCFEALASDLREVLRVAAGRAPQPTAAVLDSRTLRSTPERGGRAGDDGHKRKKGSKVDLALDTLGHLLALCVTPVNENDRAAFRRWPKPFRRRPAATWTWLGWTRATRASGRPRRRPRRHRLGGGQLPEAKRARAAAQRRVSSVPSRATDAEGWSGDDERLHTTLAGLHVVAFACLMLRNAARARHGP